MTVVIKGGRLSGDPRPPGRTRNTGTVEDLKAAGINLLIGEDKPFGHLAGWMFSFNNYYWVAEASVGGGGVVLPHKYADPLHELIGTEVRVDGHCGCPSPQRWCNPSRGYAGVALYHVDTLEGLKALADAIRQWRDAEAPEAGMSVHDWQHARARRLEPPQFTHDCEKCEYMGRSFVTWNTMVNGGWIEWYVCKSGRDLDKVERNEDGTLKLQKDCRDNPVELLNSTLVGRFDTGEKKYWTHQVKEVAEWYDPKNHVQARSKLIEAAQEKILEFELWSVPHRRPESV